MSTDIQWGIVTAIVVVAIAYFVRKAIKMQHNPCSGCRLSETCNKIDNNACKNNKKD